MARLLAVGVSCESGFLFAEAIQTSSWLSRKSPQLAHLHTRKLAGSSHSLQRCVVYAQELCYLSGIE